MERGSKVHEVHNISDVQVSFWIEWRVSMRHFMLPTSKHLMVTTSGLELGFSGGGSLLEDKCGWNRFAYWSQVCQ